MTAVEIIIITLLSVVLMAIIFIYFKWFAKSKDNKPGELAIHILTNPHTRLLDKIYREDIDENTESTIVITKNNGRGSTMRNTDMAMEELYRILDNWSKEVWNKL